MSGFDEALRREEAKQRSAAAARQSEESQRRLAAGAATAHITQLLREFVQRLAERGIKPEPVELVERRGLFHPAQYSPPGYVIGGRIDSRFDFRETLYLVTPDGQLWHWFRFDAARSGFVAITAENLAKDNVWLAGDDRITSGSDGKALVYRNGDPPTRTPLEEWLAARAVRLIKERSTRR